MRDPRLLRGLLAAVATALLAAGLQTVAATPAQAGQVGVTIDIQGAGEVRVVEGSLEDGASYVCSRFYNQNHRVTLTCPRFRNSEAFEAWVWLRPVPSSVPVGEWVFEGWRGCDETRDRDGVEECAVHSGAFSSDERHPVAVFRDAVAPVVTGATATQLPEEGHLRFEFSADDAHTECRFDVTEFAPCESGFTKEFWQGDDALQVRAEDASGNVGPITSVPFTVVETGLAGRPASLTNSRQATFRFVTNGDRFTCSLDRQEAAPCGNASSGQIGYGNLSEGTHTFRVWGHKGQWSDPVPSVWTWTVDTTAPQTQVTGHETAGDAATFTFVSFGSVESFECRLTSSGVTGTWSACSSPVSYDGLEDGTHVFEVRGRDLAGNVEQEPAYHAWSVDGSAPETTVSGGPANGAFMLDAGARFNLGSSEPGGSVACTLDGRDQTCGPGVLTLAGMSRTTHVLTAAATDAAGNTDTSPAQRTWTVPLAAADLRRGKGWKVRRSTAAYAGAYATATRKGATVTRRVAGARKLALVVGGGDRHGTVKVYAGSRLLRTVRLATSRTVSRRLLPVATFPTAYSGQIRIVVASSDRQVRIEGLGVATQ